METNTQKFTPEESLELITRTIAGYKSSYRQNNYYFLLWGWLITLASISHFLILKILLKKESYEAITWFSLANWGFFILLGMTMQFLHLYRSRRNAKVSSHLEKYMYVLWLGSGGVMILVGLISMKLHVYPSPFILSVAGLATTVSGIQIRFRPMLFGGLTMLAGGIVTAFVINEYQLLISAAALVTGYLIPGYMLNRTK